MFSDLENRLIYFEKFTQNFLDLEKILHSEQLGKFEVPTNHIFNHTITFYMPLAFRKYISYEEFNSLHLNHLTENCAWRLEH